MQTPQAEVTIPFHARRIADGAVNTHTTFNPFKDVVPHPVRYLLPRSHHPGRVALRLCHRSGLHEAV
jgi:hypothetical protein